MRRNGIASNFARLIEAHGGLDLLGGPDRPNGLDVVAVLPGDSRRDLAIEHLGDSDCTPGLIQVCCYHCWELDGNNIADPDIVFDIDPRNWEGGHWHPVHFRQESIGYDCCGVMTNLDTGRVVTVPREIKKMEAFTRKWNDVIKDQGYIELYMNEMAARKTPAPAKRRTPAATGNPVKLRVVG